MSAIHRIILSPILKKYQSGEVTMSEIDINQIFKLASLNRPDEGMKEEMSKILKFVDQLSEIQTEGVLPMVNPHDQVIQFREDVLVDSKVKVEFLDQAPEIQNDLVKVPQVV